MSTAAEKKLTMRILKIEDTLDQFSLRAQLIFSNKARGRSKPAFGAESLCDLVDELLRYADRREDLAIQKEREAK